MSNDKGWYKNIPVLLIFVLDQIILVIVGMNNIKCLFLVNLFRFIKEKKAVLFSSDSKCSKRDLIQAPLAFSSSIVSISFFNCS